MLKYYINFDNLEICSQLDKSVAYTVKISRFLVVLYCFNCTRNLVELVSDSGSVPYRSKANITDI